MLKTFSIAEGHLRPIVPTEAEILGAVWIDMHAPTREEEQKIEALAGLELPTREDMQEIELSSRLYSEGGAGLCCTNWLMARAPLSADGLIPQLP